MTGVGPGGRREEEEGEGGRGMTGRRREVSVLALSEAIDGTSFTLH